MILLFYLQLLYRCVLLVKNCTRKFSAVTVGGLGLMIVLQAFLHILVNVGIVPVTGHTLPLVSLGGTSFIIFSMAFGIILSVSRTIEKDNDRKRREAAPIPASDAEESVEQSMERIKSEGEKGLEEYEIIDEKTGEFK